MKKLWVIFFVLMLAACHSNQDKTKPVIQKTDTAAYYPVEDFFREQMQYVDLRSFSIEYDHTHDGKKDSGTITKEELQTWGKLFLEKGKTFNQRKHLFKESVFQDLSTGSFTLNYVPYDQQGGGIRNIDVLLDENTKKVKRVFIKSISANKDTAVTEQYNWQANKGLQLTRFTTAGNYSSADVVYINWRKKE